MAHRHCIVLVATGEVINVVDYNGTPSGAVPGYGAAYQAIASDIGQIGWHWDGSEFTDPYPPEIVVPVYKPVIALVAQARLIIDGEDISGIETAVGFAGAMQLDIGIYWVFFTTPQPDSDYGALPQARGADGPLCNVTDQTTDYVEVTVTDRAGVPATPTELFLSIQRAQ